MHLVNITLDLVAESLLLRAGNGALPTTYGRNDLILEEFSGRRLIILRHYSDHFPTLSSIF